MDRFNNGLRGLAVALSLTAGFAQGQTAETLVGSQAESVYLVPFMPPQNCQLGEGENCSVEVHQVFGAQAARDPAVCADFVIDGQEFTRCKKASEAVPNFEPNARFASGACAARAHAVIVNEGWDALTPERATCGCEQEWAEIKAGFIPGDCSAGGAFEGDMECPGAAMPDSRPRIDYSGNDPARYCTKDGNFFRVHPEGVRHVDSVSNVRATFYWANNPVVRHWRTNGVALSVNITGVAPCPFCTDRYGAVTSGACGVWHSTDCTATRVNFNSYSVAAIQAPLLQPNPYHTELVDFVAANAASITFEAPTTSYAPFTYDEGVWGFGFDPAIPSNAQGDTYTGNFDATGTYTGGDLLANGQLVGGGSGGGGDTGGGDTGGGDTGGGDTSGGGTGSGGGSTDIGDGALSVEAGPDIAIDETILPGFDTSGWGLSRSCPAPVVLDIGPLGQHSFSFEFMCEYAALLRGFFILSALFAGLHIVLGNRAV